VEGHRFRDRVPRKTRVERALFHRRRRRRPVGMPQIFLNNDQPPLHRLGDRLLDSGATALLVHAARTSAPQSGPRAPLLMPCDGSPPANAGEGTPWPAVADHGPPRRSSALAPRVARRRPPADGRAARSQCATNSPWCPVRARPRSGRRRAASSASAGPMPGAGERTARAPLPQPPAPDPTASLASTRQRAGRVRARTVRCARRAPVDKAAA
jgi:hypothetical protein